MAPLDWLAGLGHIQPTPELTVPRGAARSVAGSVEASVVVAALAAVSVAADGTKAPRSRDKRPTRRNITKGGRLCLVVMEQARQVADKEEEGAAWAVLMPPDRAETAFVPNADNESPTRPGSRATKEPVRSAAPG